MAHARILSVAIIAIVPLAAQAAPQPEEVAQLLGDDGRNVSWQRAAQEGTTLQLSGFALQAGELVLRAQSAEFSTAGAGDGLMQVALHGGTIASAQPFDGGGRIELRRAEAPDARVLTGIAAMQGAGIDCVAPPTASPEAGLPLTLQLEDVALEASGAMLPQGLAAERVTGAGMELELVLNPAAPACARATRLEVMDLELVAADGSSATSSGLELSRSAGEDVEVSAMLRDLAAHDAAGRRLMEAGRVSMRADVSAATLPALQAGVAAGDPLALLDTLLLDPEAPDTRVTLDLDAIFLPIGMLLPEEIRTRAGFETTDELSGDVMLDADIVSGRMTLTQRIALEGLMHSSGRLELHVGADGGSRAFDMVLGGEAPLGGLTALQLASFSFAFDDDGLGRIVETATGRAVPQHMSAGADAITAGVPGPLRGGVAAILDNVADWSGQAMTGGAEVHLAPQSPVGVAQIGLTLLRNPDALGEVLGLQAP